MYKDLQITRRELTKWMLSASLGGLAVAKSDALKTSFRSESYGLEFASVRKRIEQTIARGDATGVAVAVVQGGTIVWEEGFGWANREAGLKATPHTPFSMASLTKPFTATTLMTLVAEGKLSLDEAASRYLAKSKIVGTNGNAEAVTVRMLGAHVSGLPGMYESYIADESSLIPTPNSLLAAYGRLAYPPATCYEYSNLGYAALNAIASDLTRTEFGALMTDRVLRPLGLHDSFFGSDARRVPGGATRYDPLGHPIAHYRTSTPASGELYASVHDLARFLVFNMRPPVEGKARILSRQQIAELHRPVFTGPSGVSSTFGWFQGHTATGVSFFSKIGGDPGVANRMCFVPSKDLACVVVTNQSNAGALAYAACDDIMGKHLQDWRQPDEYCGFPSTPFTATSELRGRWQGVLEDGGANMQVQLTIDSNEHASLTLGRSRTEAVTAMLAEGSALTCVSTGQINSPDAIRTGATMLQIKLLSHDNRLIGRVFAVAGGPNFRNVQLPYVLTLSRGLDT